MKQFRIVIEELEGTTFKFGWQRVPENMSTDDFDEAIKDIVNQYSHLNRTHVKSYYVEFKEV